MKKFVIFAFALAVIAAVLLFFRNDGAELKGPSASAPGTGYLIFAGSVSSTETNLYKIPISGMTQMGPPTLFKAEQMPTLAKGEVRFPQITSDGRYVVFTERHFGGPVGSPKHDVIRFYDHSGAERDIGSPLSSMSPTFALGGDCFRLNYPEILHYTNTPDFNDHDFIIAATCADDWTALQQNSGANAPSGNQNAFGTRLLFRGMSASDYSQQLATRPPHVEFAAYSDISPVTGGFVFSAQYGRLLLTVLSDNAVERATYQVAIDAQSLIDGGVCAIGSTNCNPPGIDYLTQAYAPSVSGDGTHLMFNSEVYSDDPGRGEEMFVINLPQVNFRVAYGAASPFQATIDTMAHANAAGNEYGVFAVNGQTHYSMHRNGKLYIAEDLSSPPVELNIGPDLVAGESIWFFKN